MKRINQILLIGSLTLACMPAWAGHRERGYDFARVIDARPVYETVRYPVDEQVCWDELAWRREPAVHSSTPVILGAIIGGVLGHQIGSGHGRGPLTVAGAALGGSIGHDVARQRSPDSYYTVTENRCEIQRSWRTEQRISAWEVTYRYRGGFHQVRMREHPGERVRVRVQVY